VLFDVDVTGFVEWVFVSQYCEHVLGVLRIRGGRRVVCVHPESTRDDPRPQNAAYVTSFEESPGGPSTALLEMKR